MFHFIVSLPILTVILQLTVEATLLNPMTILGIETVSGGCASQEERESARQNIATSIRATLNESYMLTGTLCGEGLWHQVAYLNMSNSSEQCPSAWREYNSNGIRSCIRLNSASGSCSGTFYVTGRQYNKVCGRAIGYQYGSTDGFGYSAINSIDSYYVYGVSITHGTPRNHIWTLAAGWNEGGSSCQSCICPCADPDNPDNAVVPTFVGDNYYCESGNPTSSVTLHHLYTSDKIWDGEQCEGECCSNGKSPPWFSVELPNLTTDDIEVRICIAEGDIDEILLQLLELYVQ